jgi:2-dehydro-3-deoxyphosphogluconate aldolase / (4S)-4-hydroxy-2-oxoglutarate aldolase
VKREAVRGWIEDIGVIPAVRVSTAEDALFAAEAVAGGGIPIVEVELTVPGAIKVISHLVKNAPDMVVGAGSVLDAEIARGCLDAGASFLTSDGLDTAMVEFALKQGVVVFPGVLTPTELITAWKTGCDFIKVVPCSNVGGDGYIRDLKGPFPNVPLIAAGGVNQQNASKYILAGALALGIGGELVPREAIRMRQSDRIGELARRFVDFVKSGRAHRQARRPTAARPSTA